MTIDSHLRAVSACISVDDLDSCAAWYTQYLGLAVTQTRDFPELSARVAYLESGGLRLELLEQKGSQPAPARPTPPHHGAVRGVTQVTFYVDALTAVATALQAAGLTLAMDIVTVPDLNLSAFFIQDPEGNLIEFIQYDTPNCTPEIAATPV